MLLLSIAPNDSATFKLGVLANNVGMFRFVSTSWELVIVLMLKTCYSMWPLLRKEGLSTQCIALTLLWNRLVGHDPFVSLSHATYLDILTWVRSFYTRCRLEFIKISS
jgi:alpha-1,3-glucosyltransferase